MTNILIIEDEVPAANYLKGLLQQMDPQANVLGMLESVEMAISWLQNNALPDLIFMDVQLGDGTCFEIFEQVSIGCPVIFTTAHDQYAMRAFKFNSIDYLLKPIRPELLRFSMDKYYQLNKENTTAKVRVLEEIVHSQILNKKNARRSFLVPYRDKLIPLKAQDFAWLTIQNGIVTAMLHDDRSFILDKSLEELENQLDTSNFFRANRQFIISRDCIKDIELYFNGRLLMRVFPVSTNLILVSKERVPTFKKWFEDTP